MRLSPGTDLSQALKKAGPGATITADAGTYRGGVTLSTLHDFHLELTGAVFSGGASGIKFVNCRNFQVIGGEVQGATYGWFLQGCKVFSFSGSKATGCATTGFITTDIVDGSFLGCQGCGSRDQHGLYISEKAAKVRIVGGEYSRNGRAGVQVNCDKGGATDVEIRDLKAEHNQGGPSGGAAAIQLAYVNGGRVLNCDVLDHCGRHGVALFWKTRNVTVDQCLVQFAAGKGSANVSLDKSSGQNTVGTMNRFDARVKGVVRE